MNEVRVHVCPFELFEEQVTERGRREVREPNQDEANILRWWFRDALNVW